MLCFVINKINKSEKSMNNFFSPFVQEITDCKQRMRKLRKKIYKHSVLSKTKFRKSKDNTEEIISIFQLRNIPEFITENLKKRRNFDVASIKNISVPIELPLLDIQNRTFTQEQQVSGLYHNHKERMMQAKRKLQADKQQRLVQVNFDAPGIYSTEGEDLNQASIEHRQQEYRQENSVQHLSQESKQGICIENYLRLNNGDSSFGEELPLFNF